ncbi:MAG: T9SS type A sorting domain-containing protein [Flavobacteriales bacterium]
MALALLFTNGEVLAQELVPNGDFEQYYGCPNYAAQIDSVVQWFDPTGALEGSPDYFNSCATSTLVGVPSNFSGYQMARSGSGYVGLFAYATPWIWEFREYVEVGLSETLAPDSCYLFSMYVNLARLGTYATEDIGAYFSDTAIVGVLHDDALPFVPQVTNTTGFITDTLGWTEVSGLYQAHGGESFITIGNFHDDSATSLMYVDSALNYHAIYFYIEDVSLTPVDCSVGIDQEMDLSDIQVFPNPTSEALNVIGSSGEPFEVRLRDMAGRLIVLERSSGRAVLDVHHFEAGLYCYEVVLSAGTMRRGRFLKN